MALNDAFRVLHTVIKEKYTKSQTPMKAQDLRDKKSNIEFEIRFGNAKPITKMEFERIYSKLLSYGFIKVSEQYHLKIITDSSIRCEINDLSNIKEYCKTNILPTNSQYITKESLIDTRKYDNKNFNFRISIQKEYNYIEKDPEIVELYKKWPEVEKSYRYMTRLKLEHPDKKGFCIDLSIVKSIKRKGELIKENDFATSKLFLQPEEYEIEIEINNIVYTARNLDQVQDYLKETIKYISAGFQSSNFPIPLIEQHSILLEYHTLLGKRAKSLEDFVETIDSSMFIGPSSFTLQKINLVDDPINIQPCVLKNFCVTDKADGLRKLCYISSTGRMYFITMNMLVQYTGTICTTKHLFGTIFDGEHILTDKYGKSINLYAIFDIYYVGRVDKRALPFISSSNTECRHDLIKRIVPIIDYKYESALEHVSVISKKFYPITVTDSIFDCCRTLLTRIDSHLYQYETDGIIFTSTKYGVGMDSSKDEVKNYTASWKHSFKWKPPEFNTIDFVVKIKKVGMQDEIEYLDTGGGITPYKILQLYVGYSPKKHGQLNPQQTLFQGGKAKVDDTGYVPILFTPTNPTDPYAHIAYVPLKNDSSGEMKIFTEDSHVIESDCVVEFKYVMNANRKLSWIPLRIRYEKTEEYKRGKSFGNAYHVANSNWQTIHNPITKEILTDKPLIMEDIDSDVYYNKDSQKSKTVNLRNFHNIYIKKMLIDTVAGEDKSLVDLAVGKGGDLPKWLKLRFVLGIDISKDNIHNPKDGVCARFLNLKKERGVALNALFIHGDTSKLILSGEFAEDDDTREEEISRFVIQQVMGIDAPNVKFGGYVAKQFNAAPQFDICSIQFAIHYMFKDLNSIHNFIKNVSDLVQLGGYFIGTCYDGELLFNKLKDYEMGATSELFIDEKKIWGVTKQYNIGEFNKESCLGYTVSIYQESINNTIDEYLVHFPYFIELMSAYGFILESPNPEIPPIASFEEEYKKSKGKFKMTKEEQQISFLNKYFIFKKKRNVNTSQIHQSYLKGENIDYRIGNPVKVGRKIILKK